MQKAETIGQSQSIIGFDSAWANAPRAPGAICAISIDVLGTQKFIEPRLATFEQAIEFIVQQQNDHSFCLIAIDQPTIVPNLAGCRPVDRVAGSLISWLGGGVQPASRSKQAIFGDDAPIWKFKNTLLAIENPGYSRHAIDGTHLIEVFPALTLPAMQDQFFGRLKAPKYNPKHKRKFRQADWVSVVETVRQYARTTELRGMEAWMDGALNIMAPNKAHQDCLDAAVCAITAHKWRFGGPADSIMIGDVDCGYMVSLVSPQTRSKLEAAATIRNVPFQ